MRAVRCMASLVYVQRDVCVVRSVCLEEAGGKRQEAEGKRQEAGGKRQEAGGRK